MTVLCIPAIHLAGVTSTQPCSMPLIKIPFPSTMSTDLQLFLCLVALSFQLCDGSVCSCVSLSSLSKVEEQGAASSYGQADQRRRHLDLRLGCLGLNNGRQWNHWCNWVGLRHDTLQHRQSKLEGVLSGCLRASQCALTGTCYNAVCSEQLLGLNIFCSIPPTHSLAAYCTQRRAQEPTSSFVVKIFLDPSATIETPQI